MNLNRLTNDAASLEQNEFWLAILDEIKRMRSVRSTMLEKIDKEKLNFTQGEISGIDLVSGIPEKILRSLAEQEKSKEV